MTSGDSDYEISKSWVTDEVFVVPRELGMQFVKNCRVLPTRIELIKRLPRTARVAEVGTFQGEFAKRIVENCAPAELHLFDRNFSRFDRAYFHPLIRERLVELHQGDSSTLLRRFPDRYFDWIYIDGDHSFEGVSKDIAVAKKKIKIDGFLVFNDYTIYSPLQLKQYGVQRAVNDLCIGDGFEMIYFALEVHGYHDVCLRRLRPGEECARTLPATDAEEPLGPGASFGRAERALLRWTELTERARRLRKRLRNIMASSR